MSLVGLPWTRHFVLPMGWCESILSPQSIYSQKPGFVSAMFTLIFLDYS